jgi:hypothetical protein
MQVFNGDVPVSIAVKLLKAAPYGVHPQCNALTVEHGGDELFVINDPLTGDVCHHEQLCQLLLINVHTNL